MFQAASINTCALFCNAIGITIGVAIGCCNGGEIFKRAFWIWFHCLGSFVPISWADITMFIL